MVYLKKNGMIEVPPILVTMVNHFFVNDTDLHLQWTMGRVDHTSYQSSAEGCINGYEKTVFNNSDGGFLRLLGDLSDKSASVVIVKVTLPYSLTLLGFFDWITDVVDGVAEAMGDAVNLVANAVSAPACSLCKTVLLWM